MNDSGEVGRERERGGGGGGCHDEKEVPDEWQARQAIPAILQVSSSKHNAKKNTARARGAFHQSITATVIEGKGEAVY